MKYLQCVVVGMTLLGYSLCSCAVPEKKNDIVRVLVAAEGESVLASQMAGRIIALNVKLGDRVAQGNLLAKFDCSEQEARLNMAKAELNGAKQTLEAKQKLQELKSASVLEVQQAIAEVDKFSAQIQLYQAQIKLCSVHAPFSGRVTKLNAKNFESVNIGQPMIELVNDNRLKMQLNIPSVWLNRIKVNNPFTVQIDETGKTYQARVRRINGKVDVVSQSVEIEGEFVGKANDLLHGMSGTATFQ